MTRKRQKKKHRSRHSSAKSRKSHPRHHPRYSAPPSTTSNNGPSDKEIASQSVELRVTAQPKAQNHSADAAEQEQCSAPQLDDAAPPASASASATIPPGKRRKRHKPHKKASKLESQSQELNSSETTPPESKKIHQNAATEVDSPATAAAAAGTSLPEVPTPTALQPQSLDIPHAIELPESETDIGIVTKEEARTEVINPPACNPEQEDTTINNIVLFETRSTINSIINLAPPECNPEQEETRIEHTVSFESKDTNNNENNIDLTPSECNTEKEESITIDNTVSFELKDTNNITTDLALPACNSEKEESITLHNSVSVEPKDSNNITDLAPPECNDGQEGTKIEHTVSFESKDSNNNNFELSLEHNNNNMKQGSIGNFPSLEMKSTDSMTNSTVEIVEDPPTPPPLPQFLLSTPKAESRKLVKYEWVIAHHPLVVAVLLRAGYSHQELEENKDGVLDKAMAFLSQKKLKEHRRTFTISAPSSQKWSSFSLGDEHGFSNEAPAKLNLRKRRNALVPMSTSKTEELLNALDTGSIQLDTRIDQAFITLPSVGRQHRDVIDELVRTERAYVDSLRLFIREIVEPLRQSFFQTRTRRSGPSNSSDVPLSASLMGLHHIMLFNRFLNSLQKIVNTGTQFLKQLENSVADSLVETVCNAFLSHLDNFRTAYEEYIAYYSEVQEMFASFRQDNEEFEEFIRLHERYLREMVEWRQFKTESFLILPVQRLPRYHALLEDLRRGIMEDKLDGSHIDQVDKLIMQVKQISLHCNSQAREAGMAKLRAVQLQEELEVKVPVSTRHLLRETPITEPLQKLRRNGKGWKECWLYLFDDILICAKKEPRLIEQLFKAFAIRSNAEQQQTASSQNDSVSRKKTEIPFITTGPDGPVVAHILVQHHEDRGLIVHAGRNSLRITCRDTQQRDSWSSVIQTALERCRQGI